jgi:hypothetical protein
MHDPAPCREAVSQNRNIAAGDFQYGLENLMKKC